MRVVNRAASQRSKASITSIPVFPLRTVTQDNLKGLCVALWGWDICVGCYQDTECQKPTSCPWIQRGDRLMPFFNIYRQLTRGYVPEDFEKNGERTALSCHEDLFKLMICIRSFGTSTNKEDFRKRLFEDPICSIRDAVPRPDQDRAIDLALRIMTMTRHSPSIEHTDDHHDHALSHGMVHSEWGPDLLNITEIFPTRIHPSLQESDRQAQIIKKGLQAHNLLRKAGLKLEKTDDLREHLKLDEDTGVVKVFPWSSVLKESLLASLPMRQTRTMRVGTDCDRNLPFGDECHHHTHAHSDHCELQPPLPRHLALETLHTIHLLFPPSSPKSQSLLRNLVSKSGFDPDILRFKTSGLSAFELGPDEREKALRFGIWGSRLMDLYDEIENPKPRSGLDMWLERRSKSRHVMMATIAGVAAAVVLGVLGLAVGIFQAWISWQQWKLESGKAENGQ
ncbi:hypothetical protein QBC36DRAFT_347400 [Triangularia setosa]|uniref:Uncharacterized protein n=1 Tax=Triangularia setosa TaxID=2587417 RepID=A0AAN7A7C1_9PEZI|nr:hypothetical protein QBC36DRAFT_347400 [Podospora setosa]